MSVKLQLRRGTAAAWTTANPVLSAGEPGYETDTGKVKYGDGTTAWNLLEYAATNINVDDLGDVIITSPSAGQVLKYDGANWINDTDSTGGGGGAASLSELSDVLLGTLVSGQVLKYNGSNWINGSDTTISYNISAETSGSGAILRLTGSDSTTDNLTFVSGENITVSRTSDSTIRIAGGNVTATAETFASGASLKVANTGGSFGLVNLISGTNMSVVRTNSTNITLNSANFTFGLTEETTGGGGTYARLVLNNSITSGISGAMNIITGGGITITANPSTNTVTLTNSNGKVQTSTLDGSLAFYDGTGSIVTPTNTTLNWNKVTSTLSVTGTINSSTISNTGNITAGGTLFGQTLSLTPIADGSFTANPLLYPTISQHHISSINSIPLSFRRSRGTSAAPATINSGDQLGKLTFVGYDSDLSWTSGAIITATTFGTISAGSIPTSISIATTPNGGTLTTQFVFGGTGQFKCNAFTSVTTSDITFTTSPGYKVVLPAGTTIGGVSPGSFVLKGYLATSASLPGSGTTGDVYVVGPAPSHMYLWDGAAWTDIGAFQGPSGSNGAGVPTGGTAGQYLKKISSTNYDTAFASIGFADVGGLATVANTGAYSDLTGTPTLATVATSGAYADLSGTPTLATVATSGAYADLSGAPTIPADIGDLTDTGNLLFDGAYSSLTGAPTIPADIGDLTDTGNLLFDGAYSSLTGAPTIPSTLTDLGITDGTPGQVLTTDGSGGFTFTTVSGGGGGTGLGSRTTANATTSSIADGATGNVTITGFKSYALLKVQTSAAAWVRIYTTSTARTADASRAEGVDPTPGAGVIAEVITTGAQTVTITPGTIGFNDDGSPTDSIYVAVTNKSGGTTTITTTLTLLQLEA